MTFTHRDDIPVDIRRYAIATHEAGHAVAGVVYKRNVTGASLDPPDGLKGLTQFADEPGQLLDLNDAAARVTIENAIIVAMAGQVAEAEYWKSQAPRYTPLVDTQRVDDAQIDKYVEAFGYGCEGEMAFRDHCMSNTERLVRDKACAAAIKEVAEHLAENRSITRAELDEILIRHEVIDAPED